MPELMRVPTVDAGAVMPDACPAGAAPGTIPVGGIVAARNAIHPGMHSADICCSMAVSVLGDVEPTPVLDAGHEAVPFRRGRPASAAASTPARRRSWRASSRTGSCAMTAVAAVRAIRHPGRRQSLLLCRPHRLDRGGRARHPSRLAQAGRHCSTRPAWHGRALSRRSSSPETPPHNAWIPARHREGEAYWDALQLSARGRKRTTTPSTTCVAALLGLKSRERFWNEHNFVFRKSDGLFYHAKGATPAWADFAPDARPDARSRSTWRSRS